MSKNWHGALGAGAGALIVAILWQAVTPEYGWLGSAIGAVLGVYAGRWLYEKRHTPSRN